MKKIYSFLLALLGLVTLANAQSQLGEIRGKVIDSKTKKPMDYVSITIELNGVVKATTLSDDDGAYIVKTLQPGEYIVKATNLNYKNTIITDVNVISDQITFVNINMESTEGGTQLGEVVVKQKRPLVDPEGKGGGTKTSKEIMALPQRNVNSIANTVAGVDSRAGGTPNFRGARADGTAYYIDGVRVQGGSIGVPQYAIDQVQIITGGTPAQYGDFIGGAIAINTKAPSRNWQRAIEYVTASPFNKYLDNSQYNELNGFISGPIKIVNAGKGDKERVLLGFSFSGGATYQQDPRLPATDIYKVKDEKQRQINENPLVPQAAGGFIPAGEYLVKSDLQKIDYRSNTSSTNLVGQGNFTFQPANNMSVRLGYLGAYSKGRDYNYQSSLMNYSNNQVRENYTIRAYVQFTQNFNTKKTEEEAKKSLVSNAFYTVRVSYERAGGEISDAEFGRDYFRYGYIGKLTNYNAPVYTFTAKQFGDSADVYHVIGPDGKPMELRLTSPYWKQTGNRDTLLTFEQANTNRVRGNYTREVFDYYAKQGANISSISQLRGVGGLANGDQPYSVYSNMWTSPGTQQAGYGKSTNETVQLYVMSEASVAPNRNPKSKHDLQFGFTYEQQFNRSFSLATVGSSNSLWTLMRQLVNKQFGGPDSSKASATFDQNGVFQDTIRFKDLITESSQTTFDKNLRTKLMEMGVRDANGNPITSETKLSPDAYDPSIYSLKMFSADELLNNGNSIVSYYGYDYMGNRVNGKQGVNKFLNDPTNRTIGAYQPIYTAAWIQDKFVFKDLIVRLGLRMERFDANQPVLKDPYSMAPIYTAGDVRRGSSEAMKTLASAIPGSVGDNYAVYVNSENQDGILKVSGFRQGNNWYDRNGNPVTDPNTLWKTSVETDGASINRNTPYLVTPGQKLPTAESFKDYTPDVKFLPRVWFSFPISTTSQFFGTYDVLAQRPTQLTNVFLIDDYYYMINRQGNIINNPDLKMQQVTDYEIGFRQQIGSDAALGIIASYREFRNQIQQYQYVQAWPYNYTSYSNIDFSTVKSIRLEYDLRDIGNINLNASYTLQFANGTGSNNSSANALIQAGLPTQRNLFPMDFDTRHTLKGVFDYHYKEGKDYNGPIVGGKKIFENAGLNLIFNFTSGRPYTQTTTPTTGDAPNNQTQVGNVQRTQVKGTINGANLPSQFFADLNVDKNFMFRSEGLDGKTTMYRLRIYLQVQNLFNNVNVLTVYRYTGSGYTDGYITSPQAKASIQSATNAQSYVDLYNARVVNPNNFALPRLTRIGIALYF